MKKLFVILLAIGLVMFMSNFVLAGGECATIQDGTIEYGRVGDPSTEIIPIGYDQWGYNYQAHMFNGYYNNSSRPVTPVTEGTTLIMKWSDEWLSNKDCNGDRKLDRGYSCDSLNASSSACPGAWLTNHQKGSYEDVETGKTCKWEYFVKIAHPGEGAHAEDGMWYTAEGVEIGSVIWGAYARILQISNDPCADEHGVLYHSEAPVGFGFY